MSESETEKLKFQIAVGRRILAMEGCESQVGGHVSMRDPSGHALWISPYGYFDETVPGDVSMVRIETDPNIDDTIMSPAAEFHVQIYRERPDVNCIIHTHSHFAGVLSSLYRPVGMYNVSAVLFHGDQALYEDDGVLPSVDGKRMAASLGDRTVLIMKNHGILVAAPSLPIAVVKALTFERAARYHLECVVAGGTEMAEREAIRAQAQYEKYFIGPMWRSNVSRLRRTDTELFDGAPNDFIASLNA